MSLHRALSQGLLEAHPEDAARALDSLPESDSLELLSSATPEAASRAIQHIPPHRAAFVLERLQPQRACGLLAELELDFAAGLLRRVAPDARDALLKLMEPRRARSLRSLLRFPEGSAASLMDPDVLALPADLTVEQAHAHVRESPECIRYNLYILNRKQVLTGVLSLRDLLLASPEETLGSIANAGVLSLPATADRQTILAHPVWRDARNVPVVDEHGVYLGAVRYQTLRKLEKAARDKELDPSTETAEALGDLFSAGISGVLGALASSVARPLGEAEHGS